MICLNVFQVFLIFVATCALITVVVLVFQFSPKIDETIVNFNNVLLSIDEEKLIINNELHFYHNLTKEEAMYYHILISELNGTVTYNLNLFNETLHKILSLIGR